MKYYPRLDLYKASNVTYDAVTQSAYSYKWWQFVKRIDGMLVFNAYKYSPTTQRHQRKVRALLESLGMQIDMEVNSRDGLQNVNSIDVLLEIERNIA